jgi:signal transduction histidine kinase
VTRRIALTVLALIAVLLVSAVVPLGVLLTDREQSSFRSSLEGTARMVSSTAEEHMSDGKPAGVMDQQLHEADQDRKCAAVYDTAGRVVATTSCPVAVPDHAMDSLVREALAHPGTHSAKVAGRLVVAASVGDTDDPAGVAVLSRSLDPLDDRILAVWGWLAGTAVVVLAAGAFVSVRLARWVGSPLKAVDQAAERLGEGSLEVRAPVGRGPQEVRRLAASFNTMAGRMEGLVHGHRTVIADVSHQLRTPLAALRLRLDVLAEETEEGETAAELAGAQEEIARLSRLVDGLLAVARAESAVPRPVRVRVDEVVAERRGAWEPVARERRVALTTRCGVDLSAFVGAGDLEQVLDNLIANAVDAVPVGGRVHIEGTSAPGSAGQRAVVRISVSDDGPGMSEEARAAAFRRFGNPEAKGSGLGLAIVHRLVTANGGSVQLAEASGGGLSVVVELPPFRRAHNRGNRGGVQAQ